MPSSLRICLFWHNVASSNYGVSALAIAHLHLLMDAARKNNVTLIVDTWGTNAIAESSVKVKVDEIFGKDIGHYSYDKKYIFGAFKDFRRAKWNPFIDRGYNIVFDIGEGDSFSDIYGLKRFCLLALSKLFAIRMGLPLIISPQTIGPFRTFFGKRVSEYLLKSSTAVFVRDQKSGDYLNSVGVRNHRVSDVAFALPCEVREIETDCVGINISALLWHGGYTGKNQFNLGLDYRSLIISIIEGFIARGKKVYLVSHVISDDLLIEDDYRLSGDVKHSYFAEEGKVLLAPKFTGPIEAKNFISSLEFFTGSRMHATIAAVSCGVATVPLAYSRKFSGVFDSINYPYTINLYEQRMPGRIEEEFFNLYDNERSRLKENAFISARTAMANLRPYTDFLENLLKGIV